jgi:hypothetical protein
MLHTVVYFRLSVDIDPDKLSSDEIEEQRNEFIHTTCSDRVRVRVNNIMKTDHNVNYI